MALRADSQEMDERIKNALKTLSDTAASDPNDDATKSLEDFKQPETDRPQLSIHEDKTAFFDRLQTFSFSNWFAKPLWFSPIACARYGWKNVDKDLLECEGCKKPMAGKLPLSADPVLSAKCHERLFAAIKSAHHTLCPWKFHPTPVRVFAVPHPNHQNATDHFVYGASSFLGLSKRLPQIHPSVMESFGISLSVLETLYQVPASDGEYLLHESNWQLLTESSANDVEDLANIPNLIQSACLLSLTGWMLQSSISGNEQIQCSLCQRVIRLREIENFTEKHPEMESDSRSADHFMESIIALDAVMKMQRMEKHLSAADEQMNIETDSMSSREIVESIMAEILTTLCGETDQNSEEPMDVDSKNCFVSTKRSAPKKAKLDSKPTLNLLTEHRNWCPWVSDGSCSYLDKENFKEISPKEFIPGWRILLEILLPKETENQLNQSVEGLKKIRRSLHQGI